jgi:hypothetical protein
MGDVYESLLRNKLTKESDEMFLKGKRFLSINSENSFGESKDCRTINLVKSLASLDERRIENKY